MENNTGLLNKSTFSAPIHLTVLPDIFDELCKDDQRHKEAIVWDCSNFKSWIEDIFLIVVETCIQNWICFLGFLLPVVNQSGGVRDQFGLSRHCSHLWLWLEPSKWPAGTSQSSQNRSEEAGNPGFQFRRSTKTIFIAGEKRYGCSPFTGQHLSTGYQRNSGGGHHWEGQEEDGVRSSRHSENGHNWSNCAGQQFKKHKVRCEKWALSGFFLSF